MSLFFILHCWLVSPFRGISFEGYLSVLGVSSHGGNWAPIRFKSIQGLGQHFIRSFGKQVFAGWVRFIEEIIHVMCWSNRLRRHIVRNLVVVSEVIVMRKSGVMRWGDEMGRWGGAVTVVWYSVNKARTRTRYFSPSLTSLCGVLKVTRLTLQCLCWPTCTFIWILPTLLSLL